MARVALVFVISIALFLSIRSVVAEESPVPSPAHSQSWSDWFDDKMGYIGLKSKGEKAGAPTGETIGAPASA